MQTPETGPPVRRFDIKRFAGSRAERDIDTVAVEEPLLIRVRYWFKDRQTTDTLALTMRTPGHDRELAAGLLLAEGVVRSASDIACLHALGGQPSREVLAELAPGVDFEAWRLTRASVMNSSCGVCGKRSIDSLLAPQEDTAPPESGPDRFTVRPSLLACLPDLLRREQAGFARTGGLHAAALVRESGSLAAVFEDIGRHNALDKLIGSSLLAGSLPLSRSILFLTSRSSFELVQKAVAAGAPVLATVGAPSSLAIETARQYGITLIGFLRDDRFNVYSAAWRLDSR